MPYNILLMGASYGSLLASKILFGGHTIHSGLPAGGSRFDQYRRLSRPFARAGARGACGPRLAEVARQSDRRTGDRGQSGDYDLIGLCMQEPQYSASGVRQLLDAVAKSRVPCMSIRGLTSGAGHKGRPTVWYEMRQGRRA
jgi:hypothetical protein